MHMGFTFDDLERLKSRSRSQSFDSKYLGNGEIRSWTPMDFVERSHGLSIGIVMFDLG